MNKILSSVLISAIASTVTLSAATAVVGEDVPTADRLSKLYINPTTTKYNKAATLDGENLSGYDYNTSVDLPGLGQASEIVWKPFVNLTSGSKFTLRAVNSEFVLARDVSLCNKGVKVGTMVSVGTTDGSTKMNDMSFRIDDGIVDPDNLKDSNITFSTTTTCPSDETTMLALIPTGGACSSYGVEIPQAIDDSSQAFTDYTAPAITIGNAKRLVKVACDTPVCTIDAAADNKSFTLVAASTGINNSKQEEIGSNNASTYCPECEENTVATCRTTISVKNDAPFDITSLELTPSMANNAGMTVDVDFDVNSSTGGALNSLITLSDINITAGDEKNITITYNPLTNAVIEPGTVSSAITLKSGMDALQLDRRSNDLATFSVAGNTVFTVPYMNSTYKSMVKVTSLSDAEAKLSAVITDQDGLATGVVDLGTIAPKATKFLFSTSGALKDAADAAGLKNAWSVVFTISAEATVVATMAGPDGGDRAISVF